MSIAEVSSSTPLISLTASVIDTETTGLDPASVRVVQIGGVRIRNGRLLADNSFDRLVRPGVAIPPETTAVHGISDADVADAPPFPEVMAEFAGWLGNSVVLGYSVGFDLAVLKAEHRRAGLAWTRPRVVDVRHLVRVLNPVLPSHALETVAAWLGIEAADRHTALGDARATAEVFIALVPKLRDKGIRTLAEAERACRAAADGDHGEARAGWEDAAAGPMLERPAGALARIDSFPYRHQVRELMSSPARTVAAATPLREVLAQIAGSRLSSVFVEPGPGETGMGIITERDLLRLIDADLAGWAGRTAGEVATRPLLTVSQDAFAYRAIGRMTARNLRHLGVHDEHGRIVGALTTRDLLKQRASDAISLGDEIEHAGSAAELGAVWARLALVARALKAEEVDARDVAAVISRELCALTRRCCEIAERELVKAGHGAPPVAYCMLVLGSAGRGESLLAMDQDNAIVAERGGPGSAEDAWLERLGGRVADMLDAAGVPYCKGGVMAKNAAWRMPVEAWHGQVATWLSRHSPEDILSSDIFFDAVPVHGRAELGHAVRDRALELGSHSADFLKLLSVNAANVQVPVGWFGRFQLNDGRMDLKKGGLMPIFSAARVLAIKHAVAARSTPARLVAVRDREAELKPLIDNLIEAHGILIDAILTQQLADLETGTPLSNAVSPKTFREARRERLRWALNQAGSVASLLGDPLGHG